MLHGNAEAILQLFFAAENFLPGLLPGKERQTGVRTGVGPDPVACGKPLPNLQFVHQWIRFSSFARFPIAGLPNPIGHKKVNRADS